MGKVAPKNIKKLQDTWSAQEAGMGTNSREILK